MQDSNSSKSFDQKKQEFLQRRSQQSDDQKLLTFSAIEKPYNVNELEQSQIAQNCEDLLQSILTTSALPENDEIRDIRRVMNSNTYSKKDEILMTDKLLNELSENQVNALLPLVKNINIRKLVKILGNEILENIENLQEQTQQQSELKIKNLVFCFEHQNKFIAITQSDNICETTIYENVHELQSIKLVEFITTWDINDQSLFLGTENGDVYEIDINKLIIKAIHSIDLVSIDQIKFPIVVTEHGLLYNLNTKNQEQIPFEDKLVKNRRKCVLLDGMVILAELNGRVWCYKIENSVELWPKFQQQFDGRPISISLYNENKICIRTNIGQCILLEIPHAIRQGEVLDKICRMDGVPHQESNVWEVCGIRVVREQV
ncbi:hypothetical protein SS50377_23930 [Spironucleus salmonicida]|uniref:Uncharacterized protein n=1 Tax=Spironucleus salmonicida TaxID=348837 RepID=V6LVQ1_9EUKA|nr:hypothetical protein SS50377_23930 [Spironucleus salmonicida]|eukprot:EST48323.1 Hypothetical protein SS50377_11526 [Spironucleus salmonicida]